MVQLRVPDEHRFGVSIIIRLEEQQVNEVIAALNEAPTRNFQDLQSALMGKLTAIESNELVVETLLAMYWVRAGLDISIMEFVDQIVEALSLSNDDKLTISDKNEALLKERLTMLLGVTSISQAAKSTDLLTEHTNTFLNARIISDIRPVFAVDETTKFANAIIVHNLKLSYFTGSRSKEIFVAMDSKDIDKLIEVLNRAREKANILSTILEKSDIPYVEL